MPRKAHPWFRRSDGWWYVKVNGKPTKLLRGRDNRGAALTRWHDLMSELSANPPTDSRDHTVASIIDLHLTHSKQSYSPRTYDLQRHYLQLFAEAHGFRRVCECQALHLTQWLDDNPQWTSGWTRMNAIGAVQRAFNWAVQQGVLALNPFRGVKRRPGEPRRAMTEKEFRDILRATVTRRPGSWSADSPRRKPTPGRRFRQLLYFLRYSGARPGEASSLLWEDVHLDQAVIILRHHKTSRTQRTPRPRVIQLVPQMVKLLRRIRSTQPPGVCHVFLTFRGTPWNRYSLGLRMRRLRQKAKVPVDAKLYGIRHQFGTQSIINGVDIKTLAELMGHTSTRMTEHYLHLAGRQEHLAAAMQRAVATRPAT